LNWIRFLINLKEVDNTYYSHGPPLSPGHSGLTALGPAPGLGLRPLAGSRGRTAWRWLIDGERRWVKQRSIQSRAARMWGRTMRGRNGVGGGFLGDVRSRDKGGQPTWGDDDRAVKMEMGHCPGQSKWKWVTYRSAWPNKFYFQISKHHSNMQIQKGSLPMLQKQSNFVCSRIEYVEQLSALG
jgi:hypothetical protein